ncbi:MAG TPA: ribonuclease H-like domain-containing protein [candidate division Zixibacteria bacterium]|jgi:hypothetical protein
MDSAAQFRERLERIGRSLSAIPSPEPGRIVAGPLLRTAESVGAREVVSSTGRYWLRSLVHDPCAPWGECLVGDLFERAASDGLQFPLGADNRAFGRDKFVYLDCETTGLSGGAGTLAFLVALGFVREDRFVVEQYFLPEPADEPALIGALAARLSVAEALVTYNGAAFDGPLLEGRFRFWRFDPAFRNLPHLDLLHPTRALFKRRIGDCSLGNVEERILRFARVEDIPGSEVPEVYFEYLRGGVSPRLFHVFEHNRLDVVSLFVCHLWLSDRTRPESPSLGDPTDLLSLARYWLRKGRFSHALSALDEVDRRILDNAQRVESRELRARTLKRARAYDEAHEQWRQVAGLDPQRVDVCEEIAKHLEHRLRDYSGALRLVDAALESIRFRDTIGALGVDAETWRARFLHRRARLQRRLTQLGH